MSTEPIWLDVPFREKGEAKAAGARGGTHQSGVGTLRGPRWRD